MRDKITVELNKYIKRGKAFDYLVDAVELYDFNDGSLKCVYDKVAKMHGKTPSAIGRSISLAVSNSGVDDNVTSKAFIARIKERIMFEIDE